MYSVPEVDWSAMSDSTVIVETRTKSGVNALKEPIFGAPVAVYSGPANVYKKQSEIIDSVAGRVITQVLKVIIDGVIGQPLPAIPAGARVRYTDPSDGLEHHYLVDDVDTWNMEPRSVELTCNLRKSW